MERKLKFGKVAISHPLNVRKGQEIFKGLKKENERGLSNTVCPGMLLWDLRVVDERKKLQKEHVFLLEDSSGKVKMERCLKKGEKLDSGSSNVWVCSV